MDNILQSMGREVILHEQVAGFESTTTEMWKDKYFIPAKLALVHSEVTEMLEAFRHRDLENFAEEAADVLLRLLGITEGLGIDLHKAALDKIEYNKTRPLKHGGKQI